MTYVKSVLLCSSSRFTSTGAILLAGDLRRKIRNIVPDKIKNPATIPATIPPIAPPVRVVDEPATTEVVVGGADEVDDIRVVEFVYGSLVEVVVVVMTGCMVLAISNS